MKVNVMILPFPTLHHTMNTYGGSAGTGVTGHTQASSGTGVTGHTQASAGTGVTGHTHALTPGHYSIAVWTRQ